MDSSYAFQFGTRRNMELKARLEDEPTFQGLFTYHIRNAAITKSVEQWDFHLQCRKPKTMQAPVRMMLRAERPWYPHQPNGHDVRYAWSLISYTREDGRVAKASDYRICPNVAVLAALEWGDPFYLLTDVLHDAWGIMAQVYKQRQEFTCQYPLETDMRLPYAQDLGEVTIRIDNVRDLGAYVELVMNSRNTKGGDEVARRTINELKKKLGIKDDHVKGESYAELLGKKILC